MQKIIAILVMLARPIIWIVCTILDIVRMIIAPLVAVVIAIFGKEK